LATNLNIVLQSRLAWGFSNPSGLSAVKDSSNVSAKISLTNGTGPMQGNNMWADVRTVAPSSLDVLDLLGGEENVFGATLNFSAIKILWIFNNGTPSGATFELNPGADLLIGGGGVHAWSAPFSGDQTAQAPCGPGDKYEITSIVSGLAVVSNSSHLLQIQNSSTYEISYSIVIAGVT
jgi:hypothetical protein